MTLDRALALDAAGDRAEALLRIPEAQALLNALVERPTRAESLAASLFPGRSDATEQTTALVESLATHRRAGDDHAILNARYHTFVRAIEGPAVCLRPHAPDGLPRISLVSDRHCPECGEHAPMMELATCRRCNQWYLRGIVSGAREVSFKRADGQFDNLPDVADSPVKYMAPSSGESASDDDEFAESDGDEAAGGAAAARLPMRNSSPVPIAGGWGRATPGVRALPRPAADSEWRCALIPASPSGASTARRHRPWADHRVFGWVPTLRLLSWPRPSTTN
ncbi:MAG: hypothetical protein IPG47_17165 [Thermoflexaceae bacterium]|nr:hypothetical protein [Thermoflexaceae bacterium]